MKNLIPWVLMALFVCSIGCGAPMLQETTTPVRSVVAKSAAPAHCARGFAPPLASAGVTNLRRSAAAGRARLALFRKVGEGPSGVTFSTREDGTLVALACKATSPLVLRASCEMELTSIAEASRGVGMAPGGGLCRRIEALGTRVLDGDCGLDPEALEDLLFVRSVRILAGVCEEV